MSSTTDKIKGVANEVAGKTKQEIGKATGDTDMEARGAAEKLKGSAQRNVGEAKDAVKKAIDTP